MEKEPNNQNEQKTKPGLLSRMGASLSGKGKEMVGYDSIKNGWQDISESAKILNPFRKRPPPKRGNETFDEAYARNKLTESALSRIYRNQFIAFNVSLVFAFICGTISINFLLNKGVFSALSAIGPFFVCLSLAVSASFKMMKIRKRDLGLSFEDWKRNPSEWIPKKFVPAKKKRRSPSE